MAVALRLAKSGWCGGNPEEVLKLRADLVMAAVQYESFRIDYEKTYYELNKGMA